MTKKGLTWIALIALVAGTAYAAIDWEIPNNVMRFGDGSTSEKSLDFNLGLGASNPKLKSDAAGDLTSTTELGSEVGLTVGAGSDTDLGLKFDMNGTADIPEIKWDSGAGALVFKNKPGGTFKKVGSGSGSGGGENYNNAFVDQNFNAEDGTNSWSNSGGTFAVTSVDPLEGEQSFTFTSSAQFDYVESSALNMDRDVFRGQSCEARVSYIGGSDDLYLQLIDGGANVFKELQLPAHGIYGQESLFFLCPNATDIAGDANLATLKYRIANKGSGVAPLIKFDTAYLGTLRGLTETTLPDTLSAYVRTDGSIASKNSDWLTSVNLGTVGVFDLVYKSGIFTQVPACAVSPAVNGFNDYTAYKREGGVAGVTVYTLRDGVSEYRGFQIVCQKQGADAKQSVQVYKSIPKVSENVNEFSGFTSGAGSTDNQWGVNVNLVSIGLFEYDITSLGLTQVPYILADPVEAASGPFVCGYDNGFTNTNTTIRILCKNSATGTPTSINHTWQLVKRIDDFKLPTVQPIIVGTVTNSYAEAASKNVRVEACSLNNNGSSVVLKDSYCDTWIDSATRSSVGTWIIQMNPAVFKPYNITCTCNHNDTGTVGVMCGTRISGSDPYAGLEIIGRTWNVADVEVDTPVNITCTGVIP